jgi:S-adenosylmethionine/arginine decarboxylase-like enzyme
MSKIAPEIKRQRLLIEGFYSIEVKRETVEKYFQAITGALNLKTYGDPIIFSPEGLGKEENQGFDAFVPLIDSGISLYVWSSSKFFSVIIYTCKNFDEDSAVETTNEFFKSQNFETLSF